MRLRLTEIDRPLTAVVVALAAYGLATLYSAGQTDVPTFVTTIWQRQLIWLGVGLVAVVLMFRTSPRLLEWATPYAYGIGVVVLLLTLATGTGAGTAASERSWIAIGGVRLGQPAELAKLAVVLMLARWLAERREAPATLRELLPPCLIAGVPTLLVAKQPDLGSAIVFIAILFAMLYWAGTKPSLLVLLGSPAIGWCSPSRRPAWAPGSSCCLACCYCCGRMWGEAWPSFLPTSSMATSAFWSCASCGSPGGPPTRFPASASSGSRACSSATSSKTWA